ncbi:DUF262 domain-containing protein, partial [Lacticaseibacillus camelliae]|uniref:DUF262 domain-containing protein n=2 Tax=Lacticaseibacillus camelliae TaxID=381742 RepID=UPI0007052FB6
MSFVDIPEPSRFRIGNLFQDNNFIVPKYQRNFAWQENEIDDFWNDLAELADGNRSSHFFGQIVTFKNPDGNQELIDGQQRLTSSSILLAVMSDIATKAYSSNRDEMSPESGDVLRDVKRDVAKYLRAQENQPSLTLQSGNKDRDGLDANAFFSGLINGKRHKAYTEPTKNMDAAYQYFYKNVSASMNQFKTWAERVDRLSRLFRSFVDNFYVVMISAPTQRDAFIIFETLNSRGKDLKASDIIKNHLMYVAGGEMDLANQKWNDVSRELKDDSDRITRFIRTYWSARQRLVVESHLYRALSQELTNSAKANEFLDDLVQLAPVYNMLEAASLSKRQRFFNNTELAQQIDILYRMRVKLFYPILLALSKRGFSSRDMVIVMQKVIAIFIRHRAIMNDGTNRLESGYAIIAQEIWSGKLSSSSQINQALNDRLLKSNAQVKGAFLNLTKEGGQIGPKKWTLLYLLVQLYDEDLEEAAFTDDDFQLVHIDESRVSPAMVNYVGNWTLLEKALVNDYENDVGDLDAKASLLNRSNVLNFQVKCNDDNESLIVV